MVRLQNFGRARGVCENGHSVAIVIFHPRFDALAEIATQAIVDGYYREAVTSFASALERFYEFYVRVISRKNGLSADSFVASWQKVKGQSERQLGFFIATYLVENGSCPSLLPDKMASFRNSVVHKGEIPTEAETVSFGQKVIDISYPIARDIYHRFHNEVILEQHADIDPNWDFAKPGDINMTAAGGMIYNLSMSAVPVFDLSASLTERRARQT